MGKKSPADVRPFKNPIWQPSSHHSIRLGRAPFLDNFFPLFCQISVCLCCTFSILRPFWLSINLPVLIGFNRLLLISTDFQPPSDGVNHWVNFQLEKFDSKRIAFFFFWQPPMFRTWQQKHNERWRLQRRCVHWKLPAAPCRRLRILLSQTNPKINTLVLQKWMGINGKSTIATEFIIQLKMKNLSSTTRRAPNQTYNLTHDPHTIGTFLIRPYVPLLSAQISPYSRLYPQHAVRPTNFAQHTNRSNCLLSASTVCRPLTPPAVRTKSSVTTARWWSKNGEEIASITH